MALFHSSVIVNTGATQDSRTRDQLSFVFNARPQVMTAYVRFIEAGTILAAANTCVMRIGNSAGSGAFFDLQTSGSFYRIRHQNGAGALVTSVVAAVPTIGQVVELRAVLNANGSVLIGQSVAGAAETTGATSAAATLATAWAAQTLFVNGILTVLVGFNAFRNIEIMAGVQTMQAMRVRAGTD